jgi:hypothetical protein
MSKAVLDASSVVEHWEPRVLDDDNVDDDRDDDDDVAGEIF